MRIATLIKNPVYLGQARSGKIVNDAAHEPLVTQAEFDAAQSARSILPTGVVFGVGDVAEGPCPLRWP